ncbi:hypothetical protein FQN54_003687 [Arachnomyces sp. PD_36]|nr:hypothetical protein FQN54_003687 [Arachnomyces sp. PD_36]
MAGIGEASAIITVADLGLKLSKALIGYVAEVKEASHGIRSLGNEIKTTCERLHDIAGIVKKNRRFHILSHAGFQSAVRASDECKLAISDIQYALRKIEYQTQPDLDADRDKIDLSLLTRLQWPMVKRKLEAPKAELRRIRADLTLTFTAAMVMLASDQEERAIYYRKLPNLKKMQNLRAQEAKYIKRRGQDGVNQTMGDDSLSNSQSSQSSGSEDEGDALGPDFLQFKKAQKSEVSQERMREELMKLKAKQEAEEAQAQETRRKIGEEAVAVYKESLKVQEQVIASRKAFLREELSRQCLPPNQIQSIVDNFRFDSDSSDAMTGFQVSQSNQLVSESNGPAAPSNGDKAGDRNFRPRTLWRYLKGRGKPNPQATRNDLSQETASPARTLSEVCFLETWVLDLDNLDWTLYGSRPIEVDNERSKRKSREVWQHFSQIPAFPRQALGAFYQWKTREEPGKWSIFSIDLMKATVRTGFFGRVEETIGLQLKLLRREVTYGSTRFCSSSKHDAGAPRVGYIEPRVYYSGSGSPFSYKTKKEAGAMLDDPDLTSTHAGPRPSDLYQTNPGEKSNQETKMWKTPTAQHSRPYEDPYRSELERDTTDKRYPLIYDRHKHEYQAGSPSRRTPQVVGDKKSRDYREKDREHLVDSSGNESEDSRLFPFKKNREPTSPNYHYLGSTTRPRTSFRSGAQPTSRDRGDISRTLRDGETDGYDPRVRSAPDRVFSSERAGKEGKKAHALEFPDENRDINSQGGAFVAAPPRPIIKTTPELYSPASRVPSFKPVSPPVPPRSDDDVILSILKKYTSFKGNQLPMHVSHPLALPAPETRPRTSGVEDDHSKTTAPAATEVTATGPVSTRAVSPPRRVVLDSDQPRGAGLTRRPTVESFESDDDRAVTARTRGRGENSPVGVRSPSTSRTRTKPGTVRFYPSYNFIEVGTRFESGDDKNHSDNSRSLRVRDADFLIADEEARGPKNSEPGGVKDGDDGVDSGSASN